MTMQILTSSMEQWRRDVALANGNLKNPTISLALLQGEFLINTSLGYDRLTATTSDVYLTQVQGAPVAVFSQRGDAAIQAIGKVAVIDSGPSYRAEFTIYAQRLGSATLVAGEAGSYPRGMKLTLVSPDTSDTDPNAGRTILAPATNNQLVVGEVETPPASLGAKMVVRLHNGIPFEM